MTGISKSVKSSWRHSTIWVTNLLVPRLSAEKRIDALSRMLHGQPEELLQLLLAVCGTTPLRRIISCPAYPIANPTDDLSEKVRLFKEIINQDVFCVSSLLGTLYERTVIRKKRKNRGQFFTPADIATQVIHRLDPKPGETIVDPGCGTSVFGTTLQKMLRRTDSGVTYIGIEIDPILALSAAISLEVVGAPMNWRILYSNFMQLDPEFLQRFGISKVDAIVANPPFVRHHRILGQKRMLTQLSSRAELHLSGRSGMHSLFLARSTTMLSQEGRMVFLFPLVMTESNYGRHLLSQLKGKFEIQSQRVSDDFTMSVFTHRTETYRVQRTASEKQMPKLSDFAEVHRGISTGSNAFFVLSDKRVREWNLPRDCLRKVLAPKTRVDAQFSVGNTQWDESRITNKPCWLLVISPIAESRLPLAVRKYIKEGEANGISMIPTCKRREYWYSIAPPKRYRSTPTLIFTYISHGNPKFIGNPNKLCILTNVLGVHLNCKELPEEMLEKIARALTEDLAQWIKEKGVGRKYSGGLVKFEPNDVKEIPLSERTQIMLKDLTESSKHPSGERAVTLSDYLEQSDASTT